MRIHKRRGTRRRSYDKAIRRALFELLKELAS